MFQIYHGEILTILSDIFKVDKKKMEDMTLSEIVESYGEDWQIAEMKKAVKGHYKEIKVLTDVNCTGKELKATIADFAKKGYHIDIVFSLHASESKEIVFLDRCYYVNEFTQFLESNNYHIRSLYQTCCYGQNFISDWKNSGMLALNGSVDKNSISMISPVYFLQEWVGNKLPFKEAVAKAYDREIAKLRTYNDILPIESYLLTEETLEASKMLTGGQNDGILWSEFPIEQKN